MFKFYLMVIIISMGIAFYFGAYDKLIDYYGLYLSGELDASDIQNDMQDITKTLPGDSATQPQGRQGQVSDEISQMLGKAGVKGEMRDLNSLGGEPASMEKLLKKTKK